MLAAAASVLVATAGPALASAPSNDDISNATVVTNLPFNDIVDLTQATNAPGDPFSFCGGGAHTVWYQFTPAASGTYVFDPTASGGQAVSLDAFTGSPGALTFVGCGQGGPDDNGGLILNATAGTTYWIMGSTFAGASATTLDLWVYPSAPPQATITVTDVKVDQAGNANITGTLNCTGVVPNPISISGSLTQPIGRKSSVSGGISASGTCAQGQTWSALVQPTVGKFAGGAATANFGNTFVCNLSGCSAPIPTIVIKLH
jgi:hypothetical protein